MVDEVRRGVVIWLVGAHRPAPLPPPPPLLLWGSLAPARGCGSDARALALSFQGYLVVEDETIGETLTSSSRWTAC